MDQTVLFLVFPAVFRHIIKRLFHNKPYFIKRTGLVYLLYIHENIYVRFRIFGDPFYRIGKSIFYINRTETCLPFNIGKDFFQFFFRAPVITHFCTVKYTFKIQCQHVFFFFCII